MGRPKPRRQQPELRSGGSAAGPFSAAQYARHRDGSYWAVADWQLSGDRRAVAAIANRYPGSAASDQLQVVRRHARKRHPADRAGETSYYETLESERFKGEGRHVLMWAT